jgi:hypothetical protein
MRTKLTHLTDAEWIAHQEWERDNAALTAQRENDPKRPSTCAAKQPPIRPF